MYKCKNCGATSIKWVGKCPECQNYNAMELLNPGAELTKIVKFHESPPKNLPATPMEAEKSNAPTRIKTGIKEFDVSVSSGLVNGQSVLIGGDPGIGKSTLMLQISNNLALFSPGLRVLYISTEESLGQLLSRAKRLKLSSPNLFLISLNDINEILHAINNGDYGFIVIDSIQRVTMPHSETAYGSPNSLREIAHEITTACLKKNCGVFFVGHVTKEGNFAGPKTLEHIVDTVLYFDSSKRDSYRILRCYKNRFGSTDEIGVYEMSENGLTGVKNPSAYFIEERQAGSPGSVVTACLEGTRSLLIEVQALVVQSQLPVPKRVCLGIDGGRVSIIAAVLEKKEGIKLSSKEIYVKIFGGISIQEPGIDLPVAVSIISSYLEKGVSPDFIAFGEIGLTGEVRGVINPVARVKEAVNLGFSNIILPESNVKDIKGFKGVNLHPISKLKKIIEYLN
ncbi:MAG: DNA repair protein RadA [Deltaproteobacteria bacterium]|nr:DNA repair protein RadA [Deltaproteobacteria bacterium]